MASCHKCQLKIDKIDQLDSHLQCLLCNSKFHPKCVNITKISVKQAKEVRNFTWICDTCAEEGDLNVIIINKLCAIEKVVNNLNENHIKQAHEIDVLKKSVQSIKNVSSATPVVKSNRKYNEVLREDGASSSPNISEQTARKNLTKKPVNNDPVLIIRAADRSNKEIKKTVATILKRSEDPVKSLRETANGDIILVCNDKDSIEIVKNKLNSKAKNVLQVSEPKKVLPKIKLVGIDNDLIGNDDLLIVLKENNKDVFNDESEIKILNIKERNKLATALISLDCATFRKCMKKQKLAVGWTMCKVYEQVDVLRCFKCSSFGHIASNCQKNDHVCPICAGPHEVKSCTSTVLKCINCHLANVKFGTNCDVAHSSMSIKCPLLAKKTMKRKNEIRYSD